MTLIGVITGLDDHHFWTRFMATGLINAFYFLQLVWCLFFLALAYATETGWYASIKRVIEAVAGFLPYGIGFFGIVLLVITMMDGAMFILGWT